MTTLIIADPESQAFVQASFADFDLKELWPGAWVSEEGVIAFQNILSSAEPSITILVTNLRSDATAIRSSPARPQLFNALRRFSIGTILAAIRGE